MNLAAPLAVAESVGREALRTISFGSLRVAAVFRRSFYLCRERHWACFGTPEIGCGPLNIPLRTKGDIDWRSLLKPGQATKIVHGSLLIEGLAPIVLSDAEIWKPPLPSWSKGDLLIGLSELDRHLVVFPPPVSGLGCFALNGGGASDPNRQTAVVRIAARPIRALSGWLIAECPARNVPEVEQLLGLGPGLTPSGDDFLAGALGALQAVGAREHMQLLWSKLEPCLSSATNEISAAHLQCAASGQLAAAQHDVLGAILSGNSVGLRRALEMFSREAHTSPWDGLAGMATVLRATVRKRYN